MEQTQVNLVDLAKNFADNLNSLIIGLAQKINELEAENAELRHKLDSKTDDLK